MSNETLRVRLALTGKMVLMQVLEMPERFRQDFDFTASNGLRVVSNEFPALSVEMGARIALRGDDRDADHGIAEEAFGEYDQAKDYYDRIVVALREAKARMERLDHDEAKAPEEDGFAFDESVVI